MSKQINLFAAPEDAAAFHSWLLATFPDWAVMFIVSALNPAAGGVPQPIAARILGQETVCLVPEWGKDRLVYSPPDSMVSLDLFDSPALEYIPCAIEVDKGCVKVGRIYWAYCGELERAEKKQTAKIFRWIQSHSEVLPNGKWRIFPHARRFHFLRSWVGDPKPNPLYTEEEAKGAQLS